MDAHKIVVHKIDRHHVRVVYLGKLITAARFQSRPLNVFNLPLANGISGPDLREASNVD